MLISIHDTHGNDSPELTANYVNQYSWPAHSVNYFTYQKCWRQTTWQELIGCCKS